MDSPQSKRAEAFAALDAMVAAMQRVPATAVDVAPEASTAADWQTVLDAAVANDAPAETSNDES